MHTPHHAEVYLGQTIPAVVPADLIHPSADVVHLSVADWGIDDSRRLAAAAHVRPVLGGVRTLIVCAKRMTHPAQNALLKLFEEPPATTRIILIVPDIGHLLPTLLSRVSVRTVGSRTVADTSAWQAFVSQSYKERLESIADASKRKDLDWQRMMLASAVVATGLPPATRLLVDSYATSSGASRKMLLEEVALTLPIGGSAN